MEAMGLTNDIVQNWTERVETERQRTSHPDGFDPLPDIPAGRYIDPVHFELERTAMWQKTWLYAAHIDQFPEPGSFVVWRHGSAPILIIRGDDGEVRAFYNTCRHRGAPVARGATGKAGAVLVCGYHGWSYDRQGKLKAITDPRDWQDLDKNCRSLIDVRCEQFGNWIFVCEKPDVEPLADFLAPVSRFLTHLPLTELRLVNRREFDVKCNVKVLIENFLEAYHFKLLHPQTTERIFDNKGTSVHLWDNGHSMMLSPNRRKSWVDPGTIGMPEMAGSTAIERDYNPSYCFFPNLIVPIAPTGMPCVAMWPKTIRTSVLEVLWFAPDWGAGERDPLWDMRIANFDRIVDEDIQLAEPMQETIESRGFVGIPLNYQERRIYHWHEALDRRIGEEQISPSLRVAQMLSDVVE
ncbi:MAG: choline monooxygenase [Gammaproteobacteria bacterium]|jgi:choline monooxygenase